MVKRSQMLVIYIIAPALMLNFKKEERKACCRLRQPDLATPHDPRVVGGASIVQIDTATCLCNSTCREAHLLGGQCWILTQHFPATFPEGRGQSIPLAMQKEKWKKE
jgi:hypothetical protein